jgi:thymidylate synthase (FAD)
MHTKEISVELIAQTDINVDAVMRWIRGLGFESYELPTLNPEKGVTPAALLVMAAAKRCYMAFDVGQNANLSRVRTDLGEYLENILKAGHGSVLEHATYTFAIEGVSRVFTAEMNRHRAGVAISEGSMRFIRQDDLGFYVPSIFRADNDTMRKLLPETMTDDQIAEAKLTCQRVMQDAFIQMEANVKDMADAWGIEDPSLGFAAKKILTSAFRRVIGIGISTGGVWTLNIRALRHVLAMRGSKHAEEEIFVVADKIADIITEKEPFLFGDFEKIDGEWIPKYPKV